MTRYEALHRRLDGLRITRRLDPMAYALALTILYLADIEGYPDVLPVQNVTLLNLMDCSWKVLDRARKSLVEAGLISFEKGDRKNPPVYKFIYLGDNGGDVPGDNAGDYPGDNMGDYMGDNMGDYMGDNPGDEQKENAASPFRPPSHTLPPRIPPEKEKKGLRAETDVTAVLRQMEGLEDQRATCSEEKAMALPLVNGLDYTVPPSLLTELRSLFPAVDVCAQLRSMRAWLIANPERRKTPRGIKRFIVGWLTREQERLKQQTASAQLPPNFRFLEDES